MRGGATHAQQCPARLPAHRPDAWCATSSRTRCVGARQAVSPRCVCAGCLPWTGCGSVRGRSSAGRFCCEEPVSHQVAVPFDGLEVGVGVVRPVGVGTRRALPLVRRACRGFRHVLAAGCRAMPSRFRAARTMPLLAPVQLAEVQSDALRLARLDGVQPRSAGDRALEGRRLGAQCGSAGIGDGHFSVARGAWSAHGIGRAARRSSCECRWARD